MIDQGDTGLTDNSNKRVFLSPFVDDGWTVQCSSVYIFVENIYPTNHLQSTIEVTVETITHSKIAVVYNNAEEESDVGANPNDFDENGNLIVDRKNRETMLLRCLIAELNGLYIDGIGYLQLNAQGGLPGKVEMPLFNNRSFYGHATTFIVNMSGVSEEPKEYDPFSEI